MTVFGHVPVCKIGNIGAETMFLFPFPGQLNQREAKCFADPVAKRGNKGRLPFDQKFRCEFPECPVANETEFSRRLHQSGKREPPLQFAWNLSVTSRFESQIQKQTEHYYVATVTLCRPQCTAATSQKPEQQQKCWKTKGSTPDRYNGFARVLNICTFLKPTYAKQKSTPRWHIFLLELNALLTNLAVASIYRQTDIFRNNTRQRHVCLGYPIR